MRMNLNTLKWTLAVVFGALAGGCGTRNYYPDPTLKGVASQEVALITQSEYGGVHIHSIDGKVPKDPGGWPPPGDKRYTVRPGIHNLVVFYNDGSKRSVHNAEVTFAFEAGHHYNLDGWPPKVKDKTTGKKVEARLRVADE